MVPPDIGLGLDRSRIPLVGNEKLPFPRLYETGPSVGAGPNVGTGGGRLDRSRLSVLGLLTMLPPLRNGPGVAGTLGLVVESRPLRNP